MCFSRHTSQRLCGWYWVRSSVPFETGNIYRSEKLHRFPGWARKCRMQRPERDGIKCRMMKDPFHRTFVLFSSFPQGPHQAHSGEMTAFRLFTQEMKCDEKTVMNSLVMMPSGCLDARPNDAPPLPGYDDEQCGCQGATPHWSCQEQEARTLASFVRRSTLARGSGSLRAGPSCNLFSGAVAVAASPVLARLVVDRPERHPPGVDWLTGLTGSVLARACAPVRQVSTAQTFLWGRKLQHV